MGDSSIVSLESDEVYLMVPDTPTNPSTCSSYVSLATTPSGNTAPTPYLGTTGLSQKYIFEWGLV